MPLAATQALAPLLVAGAAACALGACLPERPRRGLRLVTVGSLIAGLVAAGLYVAFAAAVNVWDERPEVAEAGIVVLLAALALLSVAFHARHDRQGHHPADGGEDDGGDGGQRRPRPTPPRTPPPGGPDHPAPSWDEFDAARSSWERVPVVRR